jgi:hypothetical protein
MRSILRSLILLAFTSCLGGCAAGQIIQNIPDAPLASDLTEPNYRQIIAENLAIVFPNPVPLGMLEISGLRRTDHLKGPAWITCLRIHADNAPQEYAIFIQDSKIIDQRAGVALDRCKQQTYQAYEPSSFIHQDTKVIQQKKAAR